MSAQWAMSHLKRRWMVTAFIAAALILFYFANRGAYRAYFSDDDMSTLSWAPIAGPDTYYAAIVSPIFSELNFRPAGSLYYRFAHRAFGLHYAPYVVVLQLLHVLNVVLLFFLLERLGFTRIAAAAGALFYSFNAAVMEAYWKPMFVFDVLCTTFCLAALLLYVRGRWILALAPFWLAYKSKEIAVMLPVALLGYELLLGNRKWRRLIPYFAISLSFGLQAVWHNRSVSAGNTYALHFTPDAVLNAVGFYSAAMFFIPCLWVAVVLLPFIVRDRRLLVGIITMASMFVPLLFLPSRLLSVYWYMPMIGLAIVVSAIATRTPHWAIALFFLFWLPLNYVLLRDKRRVILAEGEAMRSLVTMLRDYKRNVPPVQAVVYENLPDRVSHWGVNGAITQIFGYRVEPAWSKGPNAQEAMAKVPMAVIAFQPPLGIKGVIRTHNGLQPYIRFDGIVPESQLGAGWFDADRSLRWIGPKAEASFYRPAGAARFEIAAFVPAISLDRQGPSTVTVFEDGTSLGTVTYSAPRIERLRWNLTPAAAGDRRITIVSRPARRGDAVDPRELGIAVTEIGYVEK